MKMKNLNYAILIFITFVSIKNSLGFVSPQIQWEKISTPHFEVVHDVSSFEAAKLYALRLELNYQRLSKYFTETPDKTIVVLNDSTDSTNGYATYIPYPHIVLYPVLPDSQSTISDYGDWIQELTVHEYTHILNFHPVEGPMKWLRRTLGTIGTPTLLLPRWWHEGIAVEMETRFSNHGRLRSPLQDAILRALVNSGRLDPYTIGQINETDIDIWPRGAHPYLFGSLILSEIQSSQPKGTINNSLLRRFSGRIPFFLNSPTIDQTGLTFDEWFEQAKKQISELVRLQNKKIESLGSTPLHSLPIQALESRSPAISGNGQFLALIIKDLWGQGRIRIFDRGQKNEPFFTNANPSNPPPPFSITEPTGEIQNIAWHPHLNYLIYSKLSMADPYSKTSDVYGLNIESKKTTRLTLGARVREPQFSPDGQSLIGVQVQNSFTRLVLFDFNEQKADLSKDSIQSLYESPLGYRISSPIFTSENTILFSERDDAGNQILKTFDLKQHRPHSISVSHPNIKDINNLSRSGEKIFFTATEGNLKNIYVTTDFFKSVQRLTNTTTASVTVAYDERLGSIYSTQMSPSGLRVASNEWPKMALPPISDGPSLLGPRYSHLSTPSYTTPSLEKEFGSSIRFHESYQPFDYLFPTYWLPFAYFSESGFGIQISTSNFDPLNKHNYSADLGFDSFNKSTQFGFNYGNSTTRWPTFVMGSVQARLNSLIQKNIVSSSFSALSSIDLTPRYSNISLGFGIGGLTTQAQTQSELLNLKRVGPLWSIQYNGAVTSPYSAQPISGTTLSFNQQFLSLLDHDHQRRTTLNLNSYLSEFLPDRHLALINIKSQDWAGRYYSTELQTTDLFSLDQTHGTTRFSVRGYEPSYFYFKSANKLSLEYQIPLGGLISAGLTPALIKRSRVHFIFDAASFDGYELNYLSLKYNRISTRNVFTSRGIELKADLTLAYGYAMTLFAGFYRRPEYSGPDKATALIGIQM